MARHLLHLLGRPHYHHGHRRHAGPRRRCPHRDLPHRRRHRVQPHRGHRRSAGSRRRYHHRDRPHRLRHRVQPLPSTVALDATPAAPSLSSSRPTSPAPPPRHILLTIVLTVPPASPSPSSPRPSSSAWPLLLHRHRTVPSRLRHRHPHRRPSSLALPPRLLVFTAIVLPSLGSAAAILTGDHHYWRCHLSSLTERLWGNDFNVDGAHRTYEARRTYACMCRVDDAHRTYEAHRRLCVHVQR